MDTEIRKMQVLAQLACSTLPIQYNIRSIQTASIVWEHFTVGGVNLHCWFWLWFPCQWIKSMDLNILHPQFSRLLQMATFLSVNTGNLGARNYIWSKYGKYLYKNKYKNRKSLLNQKSMLTYSKLCMQVTSYMYHSRFNDVANILTATHTKIFTKT